MQRKLYRPLPNLEQIVLTASNGDVFAILKTSDMFSGIYNSNGRHRAKINIGSGDVTDLTKSEMEEVPVGPSYPIKRYFRVIVTKHDTLN